MAFGTMVRKGLRVAFGADAADLPHVCHKPMGAGALKRLSDLQGFMTQVQASVASACR